MKETNYNVENLGNIINIKDQTTHAKFMSYVGNTEKGSTVDIRTPFYKGESKSYPQRDEILKKWIPQLRVLKDKLPGLYEYEMAMAEKVGPMSLQAPLNDRWDAIHEYWKAIHSPQEPISEEALHAVVDECSSIKGVRIRDVLRTLENMDLSKAAGAPFLGKKRDVEDMTIPYTIERWKGEHLQRLRRGIWLVAALLGWRGQEGGPEPEDVKQRVIWMFPFALSIEELRFYQPLIQACQRINFNPAWVSNDAVDMRMTQLMKTKGRRDKIICTDFTKFDQHFNPTMAKGVKDIYWQLISKGDTQTIEWLTDIYDIKFNLPLLAGTTLITGEHGMASGSGGTNCDETFGHRALQYEAAIGADQRLNKNSMCSGDDGCLTYPGVSKEQVTDSYTKHGLEMNLDKQDESEREATYLRRWYDIEYTIDGINRGVYATTRAIGRLCAQEREYDPNVWGPKMVTLRYLSIIENCKYHPLFEEFIEFCISGDKYRLGVDIPGFYDNLSHIVTESMAMIPNFMSYTQQFHLQSQSKIEAMRGIESWAVVRYIREHYSTQIKHKAVVMR